MSTHTHVYYLFVIADIYERCQDLGPNKLCEANSDCRNEQCECQIDTVWDYYADQCVDIKGIIHWMS